MTLTLKERAKVLALTIERERRERIRRSGLVVAAGRSERLTAADLESLMDGAAVRDDSTHSGTVWIGGVGLAPAGPTGIMASRPDEALYRRDGKRSAPTTYCDFTKSGKRRDHNRLSKGLKRMAASAKAAAIRRNPDGKPDPTPTGCNPAGYTSTLAHGRAGEGMVCETCRIPERRCYHGSRVSEVAYIGGRPFNRETGEYLTLEKATLKVGGDWRNPATADRVKGAYFVGTGEYR